MRRLGAVCAAVFFAVCLSGCSPDAAKLEHELRDVMEQRRAALTRGDAEGYARLTADDLVVLDDDGNVRTKASVLKQIRSEGARPPEHIGDVQAQVHGEIGIIAYHVDREDKLGDQTIRSETRSLETYQRQSGKWILISRAIVPLPHPNRTPAAVDPAAFDAYNGTYDFGDGFVATVRRDGGNLLIFNSEDKTPQRLLPFSEASFYQDKSWGVLSFIRDGRDKVVRLEIWDGNSTLRGRRMDR